MLLRINIPCYHILSSFQHNRYMKSGRGYLTISLIFPLFEEVSREFLLSKLVHLVCMVCEISTLNLLGGGVMPTYKFSNNDIFWAWQQSYSAHLQYQYFLDTKEDVFISISISFRCYKQPLLYYYNQNYNTMAQHVTRV